MDIRYDLMKTKMGRLLVAVTPRGVCSVDVAASDAALESRLRRHYPSAQVRRHQGGLRLQLDAVAQLLRGRSPAVPLPADLQGTAFQFRVWQELSRIPHGEVRTYSEVARALGRSKAVRAVASACASNPVPLVVPCHRVVRKNGALGGYRLGVGRKKAILAAEACGSGS